MSNGTTGCWRLEENKVGFSNSGVQVGINDVVPIDKRVVNLCLECPLKECELSISKSDKLNRKRGGKTKDGQRQYRIHNSGSPYFDKALPESNQTGQKGDNHSKEFTETAGVKIAE